MKLLSLIMTHKEAEPTVLRHPHLWTKHTGEVLFISPVDSKMNIQNLFTELGIGFAEHHGEISAQRIINVFKFALQQDWTHLLLMEYDSFALALPKEVMPEPGGVSAAVYSQNKPHKYRGKFYLHYPMLFTREGMQKVYDKLDTVKTKDRFFSDRFIGRAVEYAKIPVNNLLIKKKAFSKNTILPEHYPKLRKAVKNGAVFFHGIKDEETLKIIIG